MEVTSFVRPLVLSLLLPLFPFSSLSAQQWQRVNSLPATQMTVLLPVGDTLFVGGINKVYFSYDNGQNWDSTVVITPSLDWITAMQYAHGRLYVGTVGEGVFNSDNGGQSWQEDNNGLNGLGAKDISSLTVRGDSLYVGTYGSGVLVKKLSTNSNWTSYTAGMAWGNVESVTNIDGRLFAGDGANATVSQQVYPGSAWTLVPFDVFNGNFNSFLGVIRQGEVLLAAGSWGLYRSADEGATWTYYNPGAGFIGTARFAVSGNRVFANLVKPTGKSFLQYSDDQGLNWQTFQPASPPVGYDIALINGQLYAAHYNGLWRIDLTTPTHEVLPEMAQLGQNFPNPASGNTIIPVTLLQSGEMELTVFDASGRVICTLLHGEQAAGNYSLQFDASNLPPGPYIYRLTTKTGILSRLMTAAN